MSNEYRVFGPPGTGKTTYLSKQIVNSVEARGPENVAVASFTKAAAMELAGRDLPLPEENIGTLHAFCFRTLGKPKIAESCTETWNDQYPHWSIGKSKAAPEDAAWVEQRAEQGGGEALLMAANSLRAKLIPPGRWPGEVLTFFTAWKKWKEKKNYCDFTDLIERTLERGGPMPGSPSVGFFDEVQDFTALELSLVRSWGKHMDTCILAGDDDQCIYAFKGATPDAFLNPPVSEDRKRVLGQSWRLPSAIVDASSRWIEQLTDREPKPFAPHRQGGAVYPTASTLARPDECVFEPLVTEAMEGKGSLMILATCTYMLDGILRELRAKQAIWHNPFRRSNGAWNPFTPSRGVSTAHRLAAFCALDGAWETDGMGSWSLEDMALWTPLVAVSKVFKSGGGKALENMLTLPYPDRASMNEAVCLFCRKWMIDGLYKRLRRIATDKDMAALVPFMVPSKKEKAEYTVQVAKTWGADALAGKPPIIVGTIHSVKGGEADRVLLYPDVSPKQFRAFYQEPGSREAMRRTMYVGMTRARDTLYLASPSGQTYVDWEGVDR